MAFRVSAGTRTHAARYPYLASLAVGLDHRNSAVRTTGLVTLVAFRTMAVGVAFGTSLARSLVLIAVS